MKACCCWSLPFPWLVVEQSYRFAVMPAASHIEYLSTICEKISRYVQLLTRPLANHFIVQSPDSSGHLKAWLLSTFAFCFNYHWISTWCPEHFKVIILKNIKLRDHLIFFIANSEVKKYDKWNFASIRLDWYESS